MTAVSLGHDSAHPRSQTVAPVERKREASGRGGGPSVRRVRARSGDSAKRSAPFQRRQHDNGRKQWGFVQLIANRFPQDSSRERRSRLENNSASSLRALHHADNGPNCCAASHSRNVSAGSRFEGVLFKISLVL